MNIKHDTLHTYRVRRALIVFIVACFALISPGCSNSGNSSQAAQAVEQKAAAARKVVPAPLFKLKTLRGKDVTLSMLRGKIVVLNLWASWCGPCRDETPALERLYKSFKDSGVEFVGVAVDDTKESVGSFVSQFAMTYPVGMDDTGSISKSYDANFIPRTFVITPEGNLSFVYNGMIDEAHLRQQIMKLQPVAQK